MPRSKGEKRSFHKIAVEQSENRYQGRLKRQRIKAKQGNVERTPLQEGHLNLRQVSQAPQHFCRNSSTSTFRYHSTAFCASCTSRTSRTSRTTYTSASNRGTSNRCTSSRSNSLRCPPTPISSFLSGPPSQSIYCKMFQVQCQTLA